MHGPSTYLAGGMNVNFEYYNIEEEDFVSSSGNIPAAAFSV